MSKEIKGCALEETELLTMIKSLSDVELDLRITSTNTKSKIYKKLIDEKTRRVVEEYHNWGMHG